MIKKPRIRILKKKKEKRWIILISMKECNFWLTLIKTKSINTRTYTYMATILILLSSFRLYIYLPLSEPTWRSWTEWATVNWSPDPGEPFLQVVIVLQGCVIRSASEAPLKGMPKGPSIFCDDHACLALRGVSDMKMIFCQIWLGGR